MKKAIEGNTVKFTFDGGLAAITFDATRASAETRAYAEMHGWNARIGDSAALSRKQKDGSVINVTEEMRREEIAAIVAHYESGTTNWNMTAKPAPQNPKFLELATKWNCTYAEMLARAADEMLARLNSETN